MANVSEWHRHLDTGRAQERGEAGDLAHKSSPKMMFGGPQETERCLMHGKQRSLRSLEYDEEKKGYVCTEWERCKGTVLPNWEQQAAQPAPPRAGPPPPPNLAEHLALVKSIKDRRKVPEGKLEGTLKTWNDAKGFGFIAPSHGTEQVYMRRDDILAPEGGGPKPEPEIGMELWYSESTGANGKPRASAVTLFPGTGAPPPTPDSCMPGGGAAPAAAPPPLPPYGTYGGFVPPPPGLSGLPGGVGGPMPMPPGNLGPANRYQPY